MKKILISLLVITGGMCAYAADWSKISEKIYLDISGIMPDALQSGVYTFWTKELNDGNEDFVIAEKTYSQKIWYDLVRYSVNCSSRKIKMEDIWVYGLDNNLIASDSSLNDSWHTVPPDSIVEDYLELVCKTAAQKGLTVSETKENTEETKTQPPAGNLQFTEINPENIKSGKTSAVKETKQQASVDFGPYMKKVQTKVAANWKRPNVDESKKVTVIFTVSKSGTLVTLSEFKTSGDKEFDMTATDAVKKSVPFDALPDDYQGKGIDIRLTFDQTVHGFVLSGK